MPMKMKIPSIQFHINTSKEALIKVIDIDELYIQQEGEKYLINFEC